MQVDVLHGAWLIGLVVLAGALAGGLSCASRAPQMAAPPARTLQADWPVAWTTYRTVNGLEQDLVDLKAHGVGLISARARDVDQAREALAAARRAGMKYEISLPEITEQAQLVKDEGLEPHWAILIGGAYRGLAIDRNVFAFAPAEHEIIIEPPIYHGALPYARTGEGGEDLSSGHYLADMPDPIKAEIIVPTGRFDGRQHLKIIPATLEVCPPGTKLDVDSAASLPQVPEIQKRRLWKLKFDLRGLGAGAMLDKVGIAVYWPYYGTDTFVMAGRGNVSARATTTRQALRSLTRKRLSMWSEANGGTFPSDVVMAARYGDENFYTTGHITTSPAVSYPLWDYSEAAIAEFHRRAGQIEYPRTWGYPEIYGPDAYAWWMYLLHEACAQLCGDIRDEIATSAPGLMLFRNTTRLGVFELPNDHDGSGQELLTANLDIVHLDPYPVTRDEYRPVIPRDMSYCGGLARRYGKPLVPWMQAHAYAPGGLTHVTPEQVQRMCDEQWAQGVDAVMWLGYGPSNTFPNHPPESWEVAGRFHHRMQAQRPPKPLVKMAVLRPYRVWALSNLGHNGIRNPGDWMLQRMLDVYAVKYGQAYDVFELPPAMDEAARAKLDAELARYQVVVSTEPRDNAWVIGDGMETQEIDPATAPQVQDQFERELRHRGLIK